MQLAGRVQKNNFKIVYISLSLSRTYLDMRNIYRVCRKNLRTLKAEGFEGP